MKSSNIIDTEFLKQEMKRDESAIKKAIKEYQNIKLDVISLAEAKETITNAQNLSYLDEKTRK